MGAQLGVGGSEGPVQVWLLWAFRTILRAFLENPFGHQCHGFPSGIQEYMSTESGCNILDMYLLDQRPGFDHAGDSGILNVYNFMDGLNGLSIELASHRLRIFRNCLFIHPRFSGDLSIISFMIVSLWVSLLVLFSLTFELAFFGRYRSQFLGFMVIVMGILISMKVPNSFDSSADGRNLTDIFTFSPLMVPFLFFTF